MAWGKLSRHARGYGKEWIKLRLVILARDGGLCRCPRCISSGAIKIATEVDHIKPKADGGTDEMTNLRAVAHDCHVLLTLQQTGKLPRKRTEIGPDGWPIPIQK